MPKYFLISLVVFVLLAACTATPRENGVLEGHVTIGPLSPVMRAGESAPSPSPEMYAAWPIIVYQSDGKTEVTRITADNRGDYHIELLPGIYVVDTVHYAIGGGARLPAEIKITGSETTRLDIDIDTGIR